MVRASRLAFALVALAAGAWARAVPASAPAPVTDEEYARFGEAMASAVSHGDQHVPAKSIDSIAFMDRTLEGLKAPEAVLDGCRIGMLESLNPTLEKMFGKLKNAHFLRLDTRTAEKRALVRFINANGDATYLGFVCDRRRNGEIAWCDVHLYLFDENFSQTMHRLLGPWLGSLGNHSSPDSEGNIDDLIAIAPIARLIIDGKPHDALAAIRALPLAKQNQESIRVLRLSVARQSEPAEYARMVDEWAEDKPDDPALSLATFEAAVLRHDYPTAIARATRFEQLIGGDAYQEYLIARLHRLASEPTAARLAARHALAQEPSFTPAYDLLLDLALDNGNTADVVDLLQEIEMHFPGADMAHAIATDPKYAATRASAIYSAWLRLRPGPPARVPSK
ncbi:MAG TPA: hypothetical protein VGM73_04250 [Candidatus Didemnitutus sp.]|jgi:hypothetical protein